MAVERTPSGRAKGCWSITFDLVVVQELFEAIPAGVASLRMGRDPGVGQSLREPVDRMSRQSLRQILQERERIAPGPAQIRS
jgi:hypothetical protein